VRNRSHPGSQWLAIFVLAAALGLVVATRFYWQNQPLPDPLPVPLIADVQGDVHRPGITLLKPSATVMEAISAAGGWHTGCGAAPSRLLTSRMLHSGQRVRVICDADGPPRIELEPMEAGVRLALGEKLDLNQASAEELCLVPGLQPLTATAIVTRRNRRPWANIRELVEISGVGPRILEKWSHYLEVHEE
jgi:competence protein ComEA